MRKARRLLTHQHTTPRDLYHSKLGIIFHDTVIGLPGKALAVGFPSSAPQPFLFARVRLLREPARARLARGDREGLAAVEEEEGRDLAPTRVGQLGALHLRPAREAEVVVARPAATLLHVVLGLRTTTRARFARADGAGRATREREGGGDLAPLGVGQLGALRHHPRREPAVVVSRPAANLHVLEGGQRLHDLAPSDLEVRAAPRLSNCAATEAHVATGPVSATSLASFTSSNGPWPIIRAVYSRSHLE